MSNLRLSVSKIPDIERAFQILSRMAKTENLYFSQERGLECFILAEVNRKSLLYLHLSPDFFDEFQVKKPLEVGLHLTEVATELHQALQLSHMKLLTMYDNADGQLVIEGKNPNGLDSCRKISPLPVETPHMYAFSLVPHQYAFAIDVPARVFHAELKKHERSKTLTISFDATTKKIILDSDKQHGLISEGRDTLTLLPENIIIMMPGNVNGSNTNNKPLESQRVFVDTKYLSILMRFEKIAQVVRLWITTAKPVVFEYILQQSASRPEDNSSIQLRIGTTTRELHPYVE